MKRYLIAIILVVMSVWQMSALDFYVSSTAIGGGDGSLGSPWELQEALSAPQAIDNPGDTVWIWLRGGTYTNTYDNQTSFSCFTSGTAQSPVIFRNYNNERASIDGQHTYTLACNYGKCSYTWFWGLEILNSESSDRDHSNMDRPGGVYCTAENIKFINLIIHDMGSGLDSWKTARNSETYGCIIYNIGNNLLNGENWEGHGHGMYLQNDTIGTKVIHNNIIFSTYGYGMKVWQTTNTDALGNFDIRRNIVFNGGAPSENLGGVGKDYRTHNFFIVSNSINNPIRNVVVKHNYTYAGTNTPRPPVNAFGLNYGVDNLILDSNYITCQTRLGFNNTPVFSASVSGNKIIGGIPPAYGYYLWGFTNTDYPQNNFLPTPPTSGIDYFVLPNKYEQGRAHIAIYNWENRAQVQVDVSGYGLNPGDIYELVNVMDYFHDIIIDTLDATGLISVPMTGHTLAPIIGSAKSPISQFPLFGAFLIRRVGSGVAANLNDILINTSMEVFPNPVSTLCKVNLSIVRPGNYSLLITDVFGKQSECRSTKNYRSGKQEIEIDASNMNNGIYILQLISNREVVNGKILVCR